MLQATFASRYVLTLALAAVFGPVLHSEVRAQSCESYRVLVFSKTAGFRHDAQIRAGVELIFAMGRSRGFAVDASEDAALFNSASLSRYAVVVFLNTSGDVLDAVQETAFENYMTAGGGFVGIHSATDTEYSWPFYGALVGAWFQSHPAIQDASLQVIDSSHASTAHLPVVFSHIDEWYNFRTNPADDPDIHVLLELDESSYIGGNMGDPHPIAWYQEFPGGGRSFYTAMGHSLETYDATFFQRHLLGGILFAAGSIRSATVCQLRTFGIGSGDPALGFAGSFSAAGMLQLELSGATGNAAGFLLLSSCSRQVSLGPYEVLVDLSPSSLWTSIPIGFNSAGRFQLALPTELHLPGALGTSIFFQAAQIMPGLGLSNGLELQLCN